MLTWGPEEVVVSAKGGDSVRLFRVAAARIEYADVGGVSIAYQTLGDGPLDLLVVPGISVPIDAIDEDPSFARFHGRLASFSRLIRFDVRGVGSSDPVSLSSPPTFDDWAEDALGVLDATGSQQATVFAAYGSIATAILLARAHPERVRSFVFFHGIPRSLRAPDYPAGIPERLLDEVREITLRPDAVEAGFDALAMLAPSVADDADFRAWHDRAGNRAQSPATARALSYVLNHVDVRSLLPEIAIPTLIMHRRDSQWTRVGHSRYLAEHISGATYVELPGADDLYWVGDIDAILDEIEEFMTGSRHGPEGDVTLAAVLFTDIVASTEQAARMGHRKWTSVIDAHDAKVRAILTRYRGREIKTTGDGFLATFDATSRAVRAATEITSQAAAIGLAVRAGIHTGEIEVRPTDVIGLTVSIAKRICDLAQPGEVLISETVRGQLVGSDIVVADRGTHDLKGVPEQWHLFAISN
jgi:class 3 adenylate cyclase/voltage-gated potassium channel Kch